MSRFIVFSICFFFLIGGCKKQEIQLPLIDIPGISEIQNHSSIWIFYRGNHNGSISKLNKNNKIINTHWIFNIDRRLPMKEVIPHLIDMQKNKNKDSMHKKDGMLNYFSYADTANKQISLCLFRQTTFNNLSADEKYFMKREAGDIPEIEIKEAQLLLNGKSVELSELQSLLGKTERTGAKSAPAARLFIEGQTQYQEYLQVKAYLEAHDILTDSTEYLIN